MFVIPRMWLHGNRRCTLRCKVLCTRHCLGFGSINVILLLFVDILPNCMYNLCLCIARDITCLLFLISDFIVVSCTLYGIFVQTSAASVLISS